MKKPNAETGLLLCFQVVSRLNGADMMLKKLFRALRRKVETCFKNPGIQACFRSVGGYVQHTEYHRHTDDELVLGVQPESNRFTPNVSFRQPSGSLVNLST